MKKIIAKTFVAFSCMIYLQMFCLAGQINLVVNSDIETGDHAGWSTYASPNTIISQSWTTDNSVSYLHSLKNVMSNNGIADWRQFLPEIDTTVTYKLRAHIYASEVSSGSHSVEIQWFDSSYNYLGRNIIASTVANVWSEVKTLNISPPSNATSAWLLLRTYKPGIYYFDDIVFMREDKNLIKINGKFPMGLYSLPSTQLIRNPGFESTGNGQVSPTEWEALPYSGSATMEWDKNNFSSGEFSTKITMKSSGLSDWRQKVFQIEPGENYTLEAEIYASNASTGSHSVEAQWFDASGHYLGRNIIYASSTNTWQHVESSPLVAPANANYVWILCRAYSIGEYNFDSVKFTKNISMTDRLGECYNAGFNYILEYPPTTTLASEISNSEFDIKLSYHYGSLMYQPDGKDPIPFINSLTELSDTPSLSIWMGPEEAAWLGLDAEGIVNGCNILKANDSYYNTAPHYICLNMAPRGTPAAPTDFTTLKPYCESADIVSMDIYPVPEGNGHSNLPDKTISCVGKYVDILYNDVVTSQGTQRKPIWMVLQGGYSISLSSSSSSIELHWFDADNNFIKRDSYPIPGIGLWQNIADIEIIPPTNATNVYILARTYCPGTYYFDDISFSVNGTNLILNSDIETPGTNWTTYSSGNGSPSQTWDDVIYHSSNTSLKTIMNGGGTVDWRQHIANIDPTQIYSLSAWGYVLREPLPTWIQTRFMAYNTIIHGARGISYYSPKDITIESDAWMDLKNIATEIHSLSDVLTSYVSFRNVAVDNENIETLLMEHNGSLYLLCANTGKDFIGNVTFTISGLQLNSLLEFFENRAISINSNQFSDQFSGYQVHVYKIDNI